MTCNSFIDDLLIWILGSPLRGYIAKLYDDAVRICPHISGLPSSMDRFLQAAACEQDGVLQDLVGPVVLDLQ